MASRKRQSKMDPVVELETSIREANNQKQHLMTVSFDLEKAYESTRKFGIIKDLHSLGLREKLPNFIKSVLFEVSHRSKRTEEFWHNETVNEWQYIYIYIYIIYIYSCMHTMITSSFIYFCQNVMFGLNIWSLIKLRVFK